jgi:hypothetical protein
LVHPVYVALQRKKLKSGDARGICGGNAPETPPKAGKFYLSRLYPAFKRFI